MGSNDGARFHLVAYQNTHALISTNGNGEVALPFPVSLSILRLAPVPNTCSVLGENHLTHSFRFLLLNRATLMMASLMPSKFFDFIRVYLSFDILIFLFSTEKLTRELIYLVIVTDKSSLVAEDRSSPNGKVSNGFSLRKIVNVRQMQATNWHN